MIVDSSVWIAYFNDQDAPKVDLLKKRLALGQDVALWPVILAEVLSGFKSETDFQTAHHLLTRLTIMPIAIETHVHAAKLYRRMRKAGITVRGITDCLIAQACIESGLPLLTLDRDFQKIAEYSTLKLTH